MASFGTTIPVGFTGPNQVAVSAPTNDTVLLDFNSAADGTTIVKAGGRLTVGTAVSGTSPFADGSVSAPSITFASDLGLGFFRIGADIIGGATAGVLGFRYGGASQTAVLGSGAFAARTAGTGGTAVGHGAGAALTNTANVTALGANANASLTSAGGSTSVGSNSQATTDATSLGFGALALGTRGVAIGAGAGGGTGTQGADNVVIGPFAFDGNKTNSPTGVVAIGLNALGNNLTTAACNSTAIGSGALGALTSGSDTVAIGHNAGTFPTTGGFNVFVGTNADSGSASTGVQNCVVLGFNARATASGGVMIGSGVGTGTGVQGADNIAIGRAAFNGNLTNAVTGVVAIGVNALGADLTGVAAVNSVAVGSNALAAQTSGTNNVGVGFQAGDANQTGSNNVFIGNNADSNASNASSQVCIGSSAITGGSGIAIGSSASAGSANCLAIGVSASANGGAGSICIGASTATAGTNAIVIGNSATAGVGADTIVIGRSATGATADGLFFRTTLATVAPGLAVQFNAGAMGPTTSTIRHKTDVALAAREADGVLKLNEFDKIRVVTYKAKAEADDNKEHLGLIAEELVGKVHPSLIPRDLAGDPIGVAYDRLVCVLIQEVQALRRRVARLETPLTPMPALPAYTPVSEAALYPNYKLENERLAKQKLDSKADLKRKKAEWAANLIEKAPEKETEIMATHDNETKAEIRAEQERRAVKAAEEEEAQAKAEAEKVEAQESEVKEE